MKKIFYLLFLLAIAGCGQKHFYNDYKTVDVKKWNSKDTLQYSINIADENKNYSYAVSVRHLKSYEFSNLWLKVFVKGNGIDTSFRYEIPLFKIDGKPYGECTGSLCTQTVPLPTNLPLYKKGEYAISIVQLMRKDPLDGIEDVGIIIDKKGG